MNFYHLFFILPPAMLAYSTSKRRVFLLANAATIIVVILAFLEKNNLSGVWIETMMLSVHVAALLLPSKIEGRMRKIAPPVSFFIVLLVNQNLYDYLMATAILFFTMAVFQDNMLRNKIFMIIGMFFMLAFSLKVGAEPVILINILGIIFLSVSYVKLRTVKPNNESSFHSRSHDT